MKLKATILIINAIYLIATIIWAMIEKSFEPIVAIIGGLVSFATFFVTNDNSFVIKNKNKVVQKGNNSISIIGDVNSSNIGNATKNT
jgi:K+-sensing histidine kinase KdpD